MPKINNPDDFIPGDAARVNQIEANTRWLIAQIDEIHAALCPDKNGAWQERVRQAVEATKKLQAELDSERILYKSLSEMHRAAKKDWWDEREKLEADTDRLTKKNDRLREVLEEIEWNGPSDYSIGVRTCPYCGRRGDVSKESKWWEGHSADCEIGKLLEDTK
jgi:hypothetical protein